MTAADWIGISVAALYPLIAVCERYWPARKFPTIPNWHLFGIGLFFYVALLNVVILNVLSLDWLFEHRLLNLHELGLLPSIVLGHQLATLVMYAWHRATHSVDLLWRVFHQLHHAPRHLNVYVSGVSHPADLAVYLAIPFLIGIFILGVDPLAALMLGNIAGFNAFVQHANLRTPRWLAIFFQRPEAHCIHHERGLHRYNYSDLPLWDWVFGTLRNPATWQGETGFDEPADRRYGAMLAFTDVNAPALGKGTFASKEDSLRS